MKRSVAFRACVWLVLHSFLLVTLISPSYAQQRPQTRPQQRLNIAVLDFDARDGLTKGEATTLSDVLQAHVVDMDEFIVVDRQRIRQILEEQGFQQSEACSQVECIVEAGKILKVEKMVAGTIGKIGSLYNINVQVIDIATAQIQVNKGRQHRGDLEDLVEEVIPELSNEVAQGILGRAPRNPAQISGGGGWFWYVVGTLALGGGTVAYVLLQKQKEGGGTTPNDLPGPPVLP